MTTRHFRAMVVTQDGNDRFTRQIANRAVDDLPDGEVLIRVHFSSLNFKDALSATGNKGVTKSYPHTPGIDAAGVVEESSDAAWSPGDEVLVTGYDLGMNTSGGFAQYIRVPAAWVVRRPNGLSLRECMIYGTAGFTAALCVHRLKFCGVEPAQGEVLVTGATGGVGSIAVGLLTKAGYDVVAATGKSSEAAFLTQLGAKAVVARQEVDDASARPMLKARWAGVVDTVGGTILATAIRATQPHGVVTCCGMVASPDLHVSVFPFILRGVALWGIDSVAAEMPLRTEIWAKLGGAWKPDGLKNIATECTLNLLSAEIDRILDGKQRGRMLVNLIDSND